MQNCRSADLLLTQSEAQGRGRPRPHRGPTQRDLRRGRPWPRRGHAPDLRGHSLLQKVGRSGSDLKPGCVKAGSRDRQATREQSEDRMDSHACRRRHRPRRALWATPSSRQATLRQGASTAGPPERPPFSRGTSTVLTTNKYRSRGEQVPFSRRISTVLTRGARGARGRGGGDVVLSCRSP